MNTLKLQSSQNNPRRIFCPECLNVITKNAVKGGVELVHPTAIIKYKRENLIFCPQEDSTCSRKGQVVFISCYSRAKGRVGGTPFVQVRAPSCTVCGECFSFEFMSCGMRVKLIHISKYPAFSTCKAEIIQPIAKYIVFV